MIAVVDYGIGNLRSAEKALQHLGADARLTTDAGEISAADAVVLPGVGNFGACMRALRESGLEAVHGRRPVTAVRFSGSAWGCRCSSTAATSRRMSAGSASFAGRITRLPDTVRLPQMGWNTLEPVEASRLVAGLPDPAWCYFVHSFAPDPDDERDVAAWCDYGRRFAAAVEPGRSGPPSSTPRRAATSGWRCSATSSPRPSA